MEQKKSLISESRLNKLRNEVLGGDTVVRNPLFLTDHPD